jgi:flagellar biosynthesis protein FlhA
VVVEPTTVVATHLMETLKGNAAELLGRQEVQEMVETLKKSHPALVEEIIPGKVSLSVLHRVLQRLLRERVPIRDLVTILEALGDGAESTKDPEALTEARAPRAHQRHRAPLRRPRARCAASRWARASSRRCSVSSRRAWRSRAPPCSPPTRWPRCCATSITSPPRTPSMAGRCRSSRRRRCAWACAVSSNPCCQLPVISLAELPLQITLSSVATWEMPHAA